MMYPIIQINDYEKLEQMGSKEKFWYHDQSDNKNKLFKVGRPGTGENWAEKVASEIAQTIEIPCALYDFALWGNKQGVTSPIFVPKNGTLVHGNEVLGKVIRGYPEKITYHTREYRISSVVGILQLLKDDILLPLGYAGNPVVKKPIDVFIGYLIFDCLISNPDRHGENWGFILDHENNKFHFAPTYDHASGLGCRVSKYEIIQRLKTRDKRYTVESFVNKAKSAFSSKDGKRIQPIIAFLAAAKQSPVAGNYWMKNVENLSLRKVVDIFLKVPKHLIDESSFRFAVEILDANRKNILSCRGLI